MNPLIRIIGISIVAAISLPPIFLLAPGTTGGVSSLREALFVWPILGPPIFIVVFMYLFFEQRRNALRDQYPQSKIEEFSSESDGRIIEFSLDSNGNDDIYVRTFVSFRSNECSFTGRKLRFQIFFGRNECPNIKLCQGESGSGEGRKIVDILNCADPPIVPIKWKQGVLTVSDKGLEYIEGPYELGPVANDGIVGNLTIVDGLKGVVDEIEAIWKSSALENDRSSPE